MVDSSTIEQTLVIGNCFTYFSVLHYNLFRLVLVTFVLVAALVNKLHIY